MQDQRADMELFGSRVVARSAAVVGLGGIALVHLLDLQGKLSETPYLGVAYIGLIVGSIVAAGMLVHSDDRRGWALTAGLSVATLLGYVLNRTVGMPAATEDIGNWLEPLGLVSMFVEAGVVAVSAWALSPAAMPRTARGVEKVAFSGTN